MYFINISTYAHFDISPIATFFVKRLVSEEMFERESEVLNILHPISALTLSQYCYIKKITFVNCYCVV